jgi:6-phosphofructokinase 1
VKEPARSATWIHRLGHPRFASPLARLRREAQADFFDDMRRLLQDDVVFELRDDVSGIDTLELAGPRRDLYFEPAATSAAIVTCGGLCPGLNDVIRGLVRTLHFSYGVPTIWGIRFGYAGFVPAGDREPVRLSPAAVNDIHARGGSILGTSRNPQDAAMIVDRLVAMGIDILFVVGGVAALWNATEIVAEIARRGLPIAVVGIPKTIDNGLEGMDRSFGFESAFSEAVRSIRCTHSEVEGCPRGVGLVKLTGRESGFLAASAAVAEIGVDFVLIPEVSFRLEGESGLLACLERRLDQRGHAVLVVAEGASGHLPGTAIRRVDVSGNVRRPDVGPPLRDAIENYFAEMGRPVNLRYADPGYAIRNVPASPQDSLFCTRLAREAVHAAMAGKTGLAVSVWHGRFVHLPIPAVTQRRRLDPTGDLWLAVLESTGQPVRFE